MVVKSHISTIKDVLGNTYIAVKFLNQDYINDIIDQWVYDIDNTDDIVKHRLDMVSNQVQRDDANHHLTLISVMDIGKTDQKNIQMILGDEVSMKLCGIGKAIDTKKNNEAHFIVVESEDLQNIRMHLDLNPIDFHITIGFDKKDVFGQNKGKDSIYHRID